MDRKKTTGRQNSLEPSAGAGQDLPGISDRLDELVQRCAERIHRWLGCELPECLLILGSGFHPVLRQFRILEAVPFAELPGFPALRVQGHEGQLLFARIEDWPVLICAGRAHFYEGHDMGTVAFPVRALAGAGVKELIATNAAGGINPRFRPGDFMLISDHINFTGRNPLRGEPVDGGACFLDLAETYSRRLRKELRAAARRAELRFHEGVYLGVSGPTYETPAEIRAFRKWGADAVGMSTIPEVIMARFCGMEVAALSCITNRAAGLTRRRLTHEEVLECGRKNAAAAARWLQIFARERLAGREKSS